jgi:hypothetical protein
MISLPSFFRIERSSDRTTNSNHETLVSAQPCADELIRGTMSTPNGLADPTKEAVPSTTSTTSTTSNSVEYSHHQHHHHHHSHTHLHDHSHHSYHHLHSFSTPAASCLAAIEIIQSNPMPLSQFEKEIAEIRSLDLAPGLYECLRIFEHCEPSAVPALHERSEFTRPFNAKKLPEITLHAYISRLARHGHPTPQGLITCHVFITRLLKVRDSIHCVVLRVCGRLLSLLSCFVTLHVNSSKLVFVQLHSFHEYVRRITEPSSSCISEPRRSS